MIQELFALPEGSDLSLYFGKVLKGTNNIVQSKTVERFDRKRTNAFGQEVTIGNYIYN